MSEQPIVQPDAGPMLTCTSCGITSRSSRWGYHGTTEPVGLAARRCPTCDRWVLPRVSTPDHGQRTAGITASTDPTKHDTTEPPSTASSRRSTVEVTIEADPTRLQQALRDRERP